MKVTGILTHDEVETMSLEDFLLWCLSGAKQSYECNLLDGELSWEELTDENKVCMLAYEINCIQDGITISK